MPFTGYVLKALMGALSTLPVKGWEGCVFNLAKFLG